MNPQILIRFRLQTEQEKNDTTREPQKETPTDPVVDAQLSRLTEERRNLLASGVYYEDDQLVLDLDKEIQRLLNISSGTKS